MGTEWEEELVRGSGLWGFRCRDDGSALLGEDGSGAARQPVVGAPGKGTAIRIRGQSGDPSLPGDPAWPWSAGQLGWVDRDVKNARGPPHPSLQHTPRKHHSAQVWGWQVSALSPGTPRGLSLPGGGSWALGTAEDAGVCGLCAFWGRSHRMCQ